MKNMLYNEFLKFSTLFYFFLFSLLLFFGFSSNFTHAAGEVVPGDPSPNPQTIRTWMGIVRSPTESVENRKEAMGNLSQQTNLISALRPFYEEIDVEILNGNPLYVIFQEAPRDAFYWMYFIDAREALRKVEQWQSLAQEKMKNFLDHLSSAIGNNVVQNMNYEVAAAAYEDEKEFIDIRRHAYRVLSQLAPNQQLFTRYPALSQFWLNRFNDLLSNKNPLGVNLHVSFMHIRGIPKDLSEQVFPFIIFLDPTKNPSPKINLEHVLRDVISYLVHPLYLAKILELPNLSSYLQYQGIAYDLFERCSVVLRSPDDYAERVVSACDAKFGEVFSELVHGQRKRIDELEVKKAEETTNEGRASFDEFIDVLKKAIDKHKDDHSQVRQKFEAWKASPLSKSREFKNDQKIRELYGEDRKKVEEEKKALEAKMELLQNEEFDSARTELESWLEYLATVLQEKERKLESLREEWGKEGSDKSQLSKRFDDITLELLGSKYILFNKSEVWEITSDYMKEKSHECDLKGFLLFVEQFEGGLRSARKQLLELRDIIELAEGRKLEQVLLDDLVRKAWGPIQSMTIDYWHSEVFELRQKQI